MTTLLVKNIFAAYVFENPDWCFPKYLFRLNAEHENLSKAEYQQLVKKFWDYVERRGDYAKGELPSYAAFFGTGVASGEERTLNAVKQAFDCLKFNVQINKLTTLFVNIIHGNNLFLKEINTAMNFIMENVPEDVDIQFRHSVADKQNDSVKILLAAYV